MLRAALESQPSQAVEPKQIVDDVCAALEESNLETTDDAVVETTVPPTPHNSRTSLVEAKRRPAVAGPARDDRARRREQQRPCGRFRTRQHDWRKSRTKGSASVAADGQTICRKTVGDFSTLEKKLGRCAGQGADARAGSAEIRRYERLVRRDRLDYALDLKSLDAMPKTVAVDVVREVCRRFAVVRRG